jgi:hypothetical protein
VDGEPWYDIVEVFHAKPHGKGWTQDGMVPASETRQGVIGVLEMMLRDAKRYKTLADIEKEKK